MFSWHVEKKSSADVQVLEAGEVLLNIISSCGARSVLQSRTQAHPSHNPMSLFSRSVTSHTATPWTTARQASLSLTISWSLPRLMSIMLMMPSSHLILCHSFSTCPQSLLWWVFSNELAFCISWPKYCSFSISPSSEYAGLISFRIDWFDLAVQGTLKSFLQCHNSKASICWHPAFFMV